MLLKKLIFFVNVSSVIKQFMSVKNFTADPTAVQITFKKDVPEIVKGDFIVATAIFRIAYHLKTSGTHL